MGSRQPNQNLGAGRLTRSAITADARPCRAAPAHSDAAAPGDHVARSRDAAAAHATAHALATAAQAPAGAAAGPLTRDTTAPIAHILRSRIQSARIARTLIDLTEQRTTGGAAARRVHDAATGTAVRAGMSHRVEILSRATGRVPTGRSRTGD